MKFTAFPLLTRLLGHVSGDCSFQDTFLSVTTVERHIPEVEWGLTENISAKNYFFNPGQRNSKGDPDRHSPCGKFF